jgi:hypothetical protein
MFFICGRAPCCAQQRVCSSPNLGSSQPAAGVRGIRVLGFWESRDLYYFCKDLHTYYIYKCPYMLYLQGYKHAIHLQGSKFAIHLQGSKFAIHLQGSILYLQGSMLCIICKQDSYILYICKDPYYVDPYEMKIYILRVYKGSGCANPRPCSPPPPWRTSPRCLRRCRRWARRRRWPGRSRACPACPGPHRQCQRN